MTIQQLIDLGVKRIRKPGWPETDWMELPGLDSDGERYDKVRLVDDIESMYLYLNEVEDNKDDWISADPPESDRRKELMNRMPPREKIQELIDKRNAAIKANSGHDPWLDDKEDCDFTYMNESMNNNEINFETAKHHVLKFGPPEYRGKELYDIARFDDGLKYLDYVVGQDWLFEDTRKMIKRYLSEPSIKRDLEAII